MTARTPFRYSDQRSLIMLNAAALRLYDLLRREPGIFSNQERADLRELLDEHADDFRWEQWAVQLHFPGGLTTVEHDTEDEARSHYRQLMAEPVRRAGRIEVVRRVNVQGTYRIVAADAETSAS